MDRTRWIGGVALLVCCAAAMVLGGWPRQPDPPADAGPGEVRYELTQQNGQILDSHHAYAVRTCTGVPAKWPDLLSGCQWYLSDSGAGVFDINVGPTRGRARA